jgi:hypothetical protein
VAVARVGEHERKPADTEAFFSAGFEELKFSRIFHFRKLSQKWCKTGFAPEMPEMTTNFSSR